MPEPHARKPVDLAGGGSGSVEDERGEDLTAWVQDVFAPTITRDLNSQGTHVWCPRWWAHAEAVARLVALQEAWTVLVSGPDAPGDGASTWWLQHVDPHLKVLLHPTSGPFSRCARGHRDLEPLPCEAPPLDCIQLPLAAGDRDGEPPDAGSAAAELEDISS